MTPILTKTSMTTMAVDRDGNPLLTLNRSSNEGHYWAAAHARSLLQAGAPALGAASLAYIGPARTGVAVSAQVQSTLSTCLYPLLSARSLHRSLCNDISWVWDIMGVGYSWDKG